jgi:hypothetical protein
MSGFARICTVSWVEGATKALLGASKDSIGIGAETRIMRHD